MCCFLRPGKMKKATNMNVKLVPLTADDCEQFILDNQEAFNYGALPGAMLRNSIPWGL